MHDPYGGRLYTAFRKLVVWCVTWRKTTIAITALAFVASLGAFTLVQKQFFPTANRPELIVDLKLAQGASWAATDREVRRLEKWLGENHDVAFYTSYVGAGSPRFYLPTVPELVQRELRPGHRHDQGPRRPRARGRRSRTSCSPTTSRRCAPACSACRTARRSATR